MHVRARACVLAACQLLGHWCAGSPVHLRGCWRGVHSRAACHHVHPRHTRAYFTQTATHDTRQRVVFVNRPHPQPLNYSHPTPASLPLPFFFSLSLISHLCLQLPKTGVAAANTSDLKRTLGASFTIKRVAALKSVWVSAHTHTYTHTLFTCHDQHWDAAPPPTADAAQTSEQLLVCNGSALRSCCAPFDTITTSRR